MKLAILLPVAVLGSIAMMLGSGVLLFDSIERPAIGLDAVPAVPTAVRCECVREMATPVEAIGNLFARAHHGSRIDLEVRATSKTIQRLLDGQVDVAIVGRPPNESERLVASERGHVLNTLVLAHERLVLVVAATEGSSSRSDRENAVLTVDTQLLKSLFVDGEPQEGRSVWKPMSVAGPGIRPSLMAALGLPRSQAYSNGVESFPDPRQLLSRFVETPGAIAILPARCVDTRVLPVDVEHQGQRIDAGKFLQRPVYVVVLEENSSPTTLRFVEFTLSEVSQTVLRSHGLRGFAD